MDISTLSTSLIPCCGRGLFAAGLTLVARARAEGGAVSAWEGGGGGLAGGSLFFTGDRWTLCWCFLVGDDRGGTFFLGAACRGGWTRVGSDERENDGLGWGSGVGAGVSPWLS